MKWLRSLAAELFPRWHARQMLRQLQADNEASLDALQKFRRKIAMSGQAILPTRDTRNDPAPNPDSPGKGKTRETPKPTEIPEDETPVDVREPPAEVPHVGEHVPVKSPERAGKGPADRGAL